MDGLHDAAPEPTDVLGPAPPGGWSLVNDADYDLAGPEHDRATPWDGPVRAYALCSTPRSGSTLLSEALHFLGCAGTPIEYFDPTNAMRVLWRRWGTRTVGAYTAELHRRRVSPEGVFGVKLHWFQLTAVAAGEATARRAHGVHPTEVTHAFRRIAPDARVVRVLRRNRRRQAESWARAERTGRWYSTADCPPAPRPTIPDEEVEAFARRIDVEERSWATLLERLGIEPLVVHYEDLRDDYEATVLAVAEHVGCPVTADRVVPPRLVPQSSTP